MIQVYAAVRNRRRVTIPRAVREALAIGDRRWLRITVLDDGRALLERVPPEVPTAHLIRGSAALGAPAAEAEERHTR